MLQRWGRRTPRRVIVQFDGATGTTGHVSGVGVVIRDEQGRIMQVISKPARPQTNNEAEYEALIYALELLRRDPPQEVAFYSDSEIVVNQMRGLFSVNSPALKLLHRKACLLARAFPHVGYTHISRERNRLADALATEALWTESPWSIRGGQ